jgi:hypothetical protein
MVLNEMYAEVRDVPVTPKVGCGSNVSISADFSGEQSVPRTNPSLDYGDLNPAVGVFGVVLACGAAWAAAAALLWIF